MQSAALNKTKIYMFTNSSPLILLSMHHDKFQWKISHSLRMFAMGRPINIDCDKFQLFKRTAVIPPKRLYIRQGDTTCVWSPPIPWLIWAIIYECLCVLYINTSTFSIKNTWNVQWHSLADTGPSCPLTNTYYPSRNLLVLNIAMI